jgi:hypothetical protein
MAYRRVPDGSSPQRKTFSIPLVPCHVSPRFMLSCLIGMAFFVSLWIVYATGTLQDVMRLVHFEGPRPPPPAPPPSRPPPPTPEFNDHEAINGTNTGGDPPPLDVSQVRIVGLVFFGRRELVKILDCYLRVSFLHATLKITSLVSNPLPCPCTGTSGVDYLMPGCDGPPSSPPYGVTLRWCTWVFTGFSLDTDSPSIYRGI